jgi:nicotinamide-nucleotide amidase
MAQLELIEMARALIDLCRAKKLTIATAESCTGGLVAATLTEIPGSSDVFDRGFVTYSNDAKQAMLGVPVDALATFGAVSRETAETMASGALARAGVDLAVSITGIAGPGGALPGKPVGLVHFAATSRGGGLMHHGLMHHGLMHQERRFGDIGRTQVRLASVAVALAMLRELAETEAPRATYPA